MALDPRFIVTSDLESYYVDKDSGAPLAGGIITFYSDINRTTKKPVYQLTGSPPDYTYAVLPNPITLSDVGTFQDGLGNNIVPYYFPFQGSQEASTNVSELYYITVQSSGFVSQFTREGWPNNGDGGVNPSEEIRIKNFIPNGQFLAHNDIVSATEPPVVTYDGKTSQAIAQGGWAFQRKTGGTSVFNNSFSTAPVSGGFGLNDFPRYAFNFECVTFDASDTVRDLAILWPNVNTFSGGNPPGVQDYTFFFNARSTDTNSYLFSIYLIQYFGTGGSPTPTITQLLTTRTISNGFSPYNISVPGSLLLNTGTVGTNNDDFVAIAIRGPSSSWAIQLTDFAFVLGTQTLDVFPVQTNAEMLDEGVAGWMPTPNPDGSDLYLPLVLTPTGMTFDHSQVGQIVGAMRTAVNNELACDGTQYRTDSYSSIGIPYSRLQAALFNNTIGLPLFGTGANFVNSYVSGTGLDIVFVAQNKIGPQTNPVDGAAPTGFTFNTVFNPSTAGYTYNAYSNSVGSVTAIHTPLTAVLLPASAGTSGMAVSEFVNNTFTGVHYAFNVIAVAGSTFATGGAGKYFLFSTAATNYYMWFQTGTEVDPGVGGKTAVVCNIGSTFSLRDVGIAIQNVLNGFQDNSITIAAPPPQSSFFALISNSVTYAVWYNLNGAGTAPTGLGVELIEVDLPAVPTNTQTAIATAIAINQLFFAVPDLRGVFLRGTDPTKVWDINQAVRYGFAGNNNPAVVGSFELDSFETHVHVVGAVQLGSVTTALTAGAVNIDHIASFVSGGTLYTSSVPTVGQSGASETTPVNAYVNWFIRY